MKKSLRVVLLLTGAFVCVAGAYWAFSGKSEKELARDVKTAAVLLRKGKYPEALSLCSQVVDEDPLRHEALLIAGQAAGAMEHFEESMEWLNRIPETDDQFWPKAQLVLARTYQFQTYKIGKALEAYHNVLMHYPDDSEANLQMARLLSMSARTQECVPYIIKAIQLGVEERLPLMLLLDGSVIGNAEYLEKAIAAAPDDPNPKTGKAWHLLEAEKYDEAIALIREATHVAPDSIAAWGLLGKALVRADRTEELFKWLKDCPEGIHENGDAWRARADLARHQEDAEGALRCLLEASRLQPGSRMLHFQLQQAISRVGNVAFAKEFEVRLAQLDTIRTLMNRMFTAGTTVTHDGLVELVKTLVSVGRYWEAYSWGKQAIQLDPADQEFTRRFADIVERCQRLPLVQTVDDDNIAMNVPLEQFPIPKLTLPKSTATPKSMVAELKIDADFKFEIAQETGMEFVYLPGFTETPQHRMFEFSGCGLGVCDFDQDGDPDVYCSQGSADWNAENNTASDRLYQNVSGARFVDVTQQAGIKEFRFGQGVACGDYDSDGFADLYVANIGGNTLWHNNGDGTFAEVTTQAGLDEEVWTTSCLIADLNGDTHPDIYDVNYVEADDVYSRTCTNIAGNPSQCRPFDFENCHDQVWLNRGDGTFENASDRVFSEPPEGKGLGIAAWDADGSGRLSIFVADDITPNLFLQPQNSGESFQLVNNALVAGVAVSREGKPEACMGVAVADVDGDGLQDIHVTNFHNESNTLYQSVGPGLFDDRTRDVDLHHPSWELLGFGTQFLDVNLDGKFELFVGNGHLEAAQPGSIPYQMQPKLFAWNGKRFLDMTAPSVGPYFADTHVVRAVANLDWNLDGKPDLLVGQREEPNVLLTNMTPDAGNFLKITLVGTDSPRDAFGTTVTVRIGDRTSVHQLVAGGGYQATSERCIIIGCGPSPQVDELTVKWPSGLIETLSDITTDKNLIVVEKIHRFSLRW